MSKKEDKLDNLDKHDPKECECLICLLESVINELDVMGIHSEICEDLIEVANFVNVVLTALPSEVVSQIHDHAEKNYNIFSNEFYKRLDLSKKNIDLDGNIIDYTKIIKGNDTYH